MNKKYIIFALALFACFGYLKNINATMPIPNDSCMREKTAPSSNQILNYFGKKDRIAYDSPKYLLKNIHFECLEFNAEDIKKLNGVLTKCTGLEMLSLAGSKGIDFTKLKWTDCKKLKTLDLHYTNIDAAGLNKILTGCQELKELNLLWCEKLDEKYRQEYKTQKAIEQLKKDLGIENPKSVPTNPTQKPSWLVATWQGLSTHWKWTIGVGAVAIPVIGALIFYKKSHTLQNLSSALWHRLPLFSKRQKTVNSPFKLRTA